MGSQISPSPSVGLLPPAHGAITRDRPSSRRPVLGAAGRTGIVGYLSRNDFSVSNWPQPPESPKASPIKRLARIWADDLLYRLFATGIGEEVESDRPGRLHDSRLQGRSERLVQAVHAAQVSS